MNTKKTRKRRATGTRVSAKSNIQSDNGASAPQRKAPKRERRRRVPFGGFQQRLEVKNKDPEFFYYWQKDSGDNLQRMLDAGYDFVTKEQAGRYAPETLTNMDVTGGNQSIVDRVEVFAGSNVHGDEFNLVLMRQPMEWHLEDMADLEARNAAVDESIFRGEFNDDKGDGDRAIRYGNVDVTVRHEE